MYLSDALEVVVRRWIIVAIGLVATVGVVFHTLNTVGPDYQATSQVVLLTSGATAGTNPYVDFPQGLDTTAAGLAASVTSRDTQASMAEQGLSAAYDVSIAPDAGPLLVITATDPDPATAIATRNAVMALMSTTLNRMQSDAGVPATLTVSVQPMTVSSSADVLPGSRLRAVVAVAAAGVLLVLFVTLLIDRLLLRRAERRREEVASEDLDADDPGRVQPISTRPGVRVPIGSRPGTAPPDEPRRTGRSIAG